MLGAGRARITCQPLPGGRLGCQGVVGIPAACGVCVSPPGSRLLSKVGVVASGAVPWRFLGKRHFCGGSSPCTSSICALAQLCCPVLSFVSARVWAEGVPQRAAPSPPSSPGGCRHLPVRGSQPLGHGCGEDQAHCARYSSDQSPSAHPSAQPLPQHLTAKRGCQGVSKSLPFCPIQCPPSSLPARWSWWCWRGWRCCCPAPPAVSPSLACPGAGREPWCGAGRPLCCPPGSCCSGMSG